MLIKRLRMNTHLKIKNICSNDCANKVLEYLKPLDGISEVKVCLERRRISFVYWSHNALEGARIVLQKKGYPIIQDPRVKITKSKRPLMNNNANLEI